MMVPQLVPVDPRLSAGGAARARARPLAAGAMRRQLFGGGPLVTESSQTQHLLPPRLRARRAAEPASALLLAGADGLYLDRRERALQRPLREQPGAAPADPAAARLDRRPPRPADGDQPQRLPGRPDPRPHRGPGPADRRARPACSACRPRRSHRIREELERGRGLPAGAGRRASHRSRNMRRSTVRLPELPGVSPLRGFSRFYPDGRGGRPSGRLCRHAQPARNMRRRTATRC